MCVDRTLFTGRFAIMGTGRAALVELLGWRLWFQLFWAAAVGPLKEHFWFHHLLPIASVTLDVNRGRWFLRSCENRLCSLQVRPTVSGVGGCSCTQASSPCPLKAVVNLLSPCVCQRNKLSWKKATDIWEQRVLLWVSHTALSSVVYLKSY